MRFTILGLGLFLFVTQVLASVAAGPYETVFFYYVYRIDVIINGDIHSIARDCPGSAGRGACYFDEFVRYIQANLDAAVQQLRASGCENRFDARKLDPAQYPLTIEKPRYWELTGHVVEKTAKNIEKWGKTALSTQLHYMQLAFELVYEARIGDMARGLVKDTNKLLRKASNDWRAVTYEKELANGHRITMVDTQATMDAHPEMSDEMLGAVMDLVEDYGSARSAGKSHYKTLQALQEYQNRLLVSCGLLQE